MALTPKELLAKNTPDMDLIRRIEKRVDETLRTKDIYSGVRITVSFFTEANSISMPTATELARVYQRAGWKDVMVDRDSLQLSMTCPRYRGSE